VAQLSEGTYSAITRLPLASDLVRDSRQQLVARLDNAYQNNNEIFQAVLVMIRGKCSALVRLRHVVHACAAMLRVRRVWLRTTQRGGDAQGSGVRLRR
jgi:hypothetical protein